MTMIEGQSSQAQLDDIQKTVKALLAKTDLLADQLDFLVRAVGEAREGIAAASQNPMAKMFLKNMGLGV